MGEIKYGLELFRESEDRYIALKYLRDGFGLVYDEKKGEWKL